MNPSKNAEDLDGDIFDALDDQDDKSDEPEEPELFEEILTCQWNGRRPTK